jgi:hypothetical protein
MRRIMIAPPPEVLDQIRDIAAAERRTPKEQIEHILIEHVRQREKAAQVGAANA